VTRALECHIISSYAIGIIVALFLHLLLPEDADSAIDEEKQGYYKAFHDTESIAANIQEAT